MNRKTRNAHEGPLSEVRQFKVKSQKSKCQWTYCVVEPGGAPAPAAPRPRRRRRRGGRLREERSSRHSSGSTPVPRAVVASASVRPARRAVVSRGTVAVPACRRTGNEHAVALAEGRRTGGDDAVAFGEALQNLYLLRPGRCRPTPV